MVEWIRLFVVLAVAGTLVACTSSPDDTLFSFLPPDSTNVTFVNEVEDQPERHVLNYDYLYNGGGVAAGDVNDDGRPDLYFTANMGPNELYLNRGGFRFEEVTEQAGVQDTSGWTTGVTMADVNGDGHLDIYVCKSGPIGTEPRRNELFINEGDGTFTERAAAYGLDASSYSVHATFFDYDKDGDLDLYLLNNPPIRDGRFSAQPTLRQRADFSNDQLFRNDTDTSGTVAFVDATEQSGLKHDAIGFGLSATVSDVNGDGWPDVYVANDYKVEDRLYMNQGDGTFTNAIHDWADYMSRSSMGADIADYNNDGRPDIFVLDMLPEGNRRQKLLNLGQMPIRRTSDQYVRNMLHLNNGNLGSRSGQTGSFSEIGQLAGVSNTGWSWAALFADYDLDGFKDLYVTNGVRYDYTNKDFQISDYLPTLKSKGEDPSEFYKLVEKIPSNPISNYIFRNQGDLTFAKKRAEWGMDQKGFSNGAAYADLDTDGDLDLVVNNIDDPAWIYRNNAVEQTDHHYLRVELEGTGQNRFGIGGTVELTTPAEQTLSQEMMPARGFQSSVEPVLTFGLGEAETVALTVTWPDGTRQHVEDVRANQTITLHQQEAQPDEPNPDEPNPDEPDRRFKQKSPDKRGLAFTHQENRYEDYREEPLMLHMLARLGPALARGDVNGDGRDDVFVGGARGQSSALFVQRPDGTFDSLAVEAFEADKNYEDVAAAFVDVDGDGAQDLYVVSGGTATVRAETFQDRVYLNDGTGSFEAAPEVVPSIKSSGGTVAAHDFDEDGDVDLFVGGRVRSGAYPLAPRSYVLENTGGTFEDVTAQASNALKRPGMVADARWTDLTGNGTKELVLAGEWMPLRVFRHDGETFTEMTGKLGLERSSAWWNHLATADLDDDGDLDIIAGNRGRNGYLQARPDEPVSAYVDDFNRDGAPEPILTHHIDGTEYPVPRRDRLLGELSILRTRFPTYESYAEASIDDVLSDKQKEQAQRLRAYTFASSIFEQQEDGTFARHDLPMEAQFSPTRGILVRDVNEDDRPDLLLAGNDYTRRRPWGPIEAGKGLLLVNQGNLSFDAQRPYESGFYAPGDVRDLLLVPTPDAPLVVVGNNDAPVDLYELASPSREGSAQVSE
jgi:hypothetical protein